MNKKRIGIDINEVLRARWLQFDRYYVEEFGEEGVPRVPYVYDFWEGYEWNDAEEELELLIDNAPEDISELDYIKEEDEEKSKAETILFKTEKFKMSAREVYNKFMFETFCYEIFGSAPKMYKRVDYDLDLFYKKFKDQFEFVLVSKENWFSIAPTLFFLSKLTPRIKNYVFAETNDEIWDAVDVLITTDPELLDAPKNKKVIKLSRPYNGGINTADHETLNFIDLIKDELGIPRLDEEFVKIIGYIKQEEDLLDEEKYEEIREKLTKEENK